MWETSGRKNGVEKFEGKNRQKIGGRKRGRERERDLKRENLLAEVVVKISLYICMCLRDVKEE